MPETSGEINDIRHNVKKILMLLSGNDIDKTDTGLVGEVDKMRRELDELKRWKDRTIYLIIGLSLGAGYSLSDIIAKLFAK